MNRLLLLAPRIATNRLWARAGEVPSFHIAPARTQNARDLITGSVLGTYNSASPAWAVGPDGILYQPAANAPMIEYDPTTLACLGARIWGVVTNRIRNNTMVGAVAGTPGTLPTNWLITTRGLTQTIVGTGTLNGVNYIDIRMNGTTTQVGPVEIRSDGIASITGISASQPWAQSAWIAIISGSTSNITNARLIFNEYSAGLTYLRTATNASNILSQGASFVRVGGVITTGASTAIGEQILLLDTAGSGVAIDITLRIGLPQLEQSETVGPVVKTTTTAASSTADVWDITSLTAGINNLKTLYFRGRTAASGTRGIASLNDNTANNRLELSTSGTTAKATAVTSAATVADLSGGTIAANTTFRLAVRLDTDSYALSLNGGAVVTDTSGARALVDRLFIGRDQAGNYQNGYIEEMAGWTKPCADGQLSALAAS